MRNRPFPTNPNVVFSLLFSSLAAAFELEREGEGMAAGFVVRLLFVPIPNSAQKCWAGASLVASF